MDFKRNEKNTPDYKSKIRSAYRRYNPDEDYPAEYDDYQNRKVGQDSDIKGIQIQNITSSKIGKHINYDLYLPIIQYKSKSGEMGFSEYSGYFMFNPITHIVHFPNGIERQFRGLGLGMKTYLHFLAKFGWIVGDKGHKSRSDDARKIWAYLKKSPNVYYAIVKDVATNVEYELASTTPIESNKSILRRYLPIKIESKQFLEEVLDDSQLDSDQILIKNISVSDIRVGNPKKTTSKYFVRIPIEINKNGIEVKNSFDEPLEVSIEDFGDKNVIHVPYGIEDRFKNLGLGVKIYQAIARRLGFISSWVKNRTPDANRVWASLTNKAPELQIKMLPEDGLQIAYVKKYYDKIKDKLHNISNNI